jgi:hypothetical protein
MLPMLQYFYRNGSRENVSKLTQTKKPQARRACGFSIITGSISYAT